MPFEELEQWVGRAETCSDLITATPVAALAATLDREDPAPAPGDPVPPLWHWLWFWPARRTAELGPDGHPARGGFLPPVPLPRRMWAGGRLEFRQPLRIGDAATRTSTIASVKAKDGRTGPLVFVVVRHEFANENGLAVVEEQDLVYRGPGGATAAAQPAPAEFAWRRVVEPGDVLLFRYSALTFNGHRIHYDRRYATTVEGYPGLVVHGPLLATLLAGVVRDHAPEFPMKRFEFRAVRALFDTAPFQVCGAPAPDGRSIQLWAADLEGNLAMTATASL